MFRFVLALISVMTSQAILLEGDSCNPTKPRKPDSEDMTPGTCKQVGTCPGNWFYGISSSPACGEPGSDYKEPSTLVCCYND